jgi:hypothetical protein
MNEASCDNCGRELAPTEGAAIRAETRDGVPLKAAVFCDSCLAMLPGRADIASRTVDVKMTTPTALDELPARHRTALTWFADRAGTEVGWPKPLSDGTLLVCRPKGIYKPAWSRYALSVRESLTRRYPDEEPTQRGSGDGWSYRYFQENLDPAQRDLEYSNDGLVMCMRDGVPVGVLRQVARRPTSTYLVLGVAVVREWRDGFFHLESI